MKPGKVLMLFAFVCALAASAVDVNIEGRWVSGGVPRTRVSTTCNIRLYDAASGGTLLAEVPGVGLSTDSNGYFVVSTAVTPQQAVPDTFWVGVKPATGDEISPRFRVAPVPFALVADEVAIVKSDKALELTGEAMIERLDVSGGLKTKDWTVPANSVVTAKNIQVGNVRLDKLDICKAGMLGFFNDDGALVPVTVLQAGPCVVTRVKTKESDGYDAVQVAFGEIRAKLVNKPDAGQLEKAGIEKKTVTRGEGKREIYEAGRFLREFRFENASEYSIKDEIKADIFAAGDRVDATAVSKGKGFQGVIKRLGQHRGPMTHGSKFHRHQGSNGSSSDPSRVFKGKGMAGQMGHVQVTTQNLTVVRVDAENNLILVKGAVPGPRKALVTLKETVKSRK